MARPHNGPVTNSTIIKRNMHARHKLSAIKKLNYIILGMTAIETFTTPYIP